MPEGLEAVPKGLGSNEERRDVDEIFDPVRNQVVQFQEGNYQAGNFETLAFILIFLNYSMRKMVQSTSENRTFGFKTAFFNI